MNYTLELSSELSKQHAVHILFTRRDLSREPYGVRDGEYRGLPFTEIIHNGHWESFEQTYRDARIDEIFARVLAVVRPDVVHVQHLLFLSANLVRMARAAGIPVVFTLHDFWLMCPREIRMKPDMRLCFEVKPAECDACINAPAMTTSRLERTALHTLQRLSRYTGSKTLDVARRLSSLVPATLRAGVRRLRGAARRPGSGPQAAATSAIEARNAFLADVCSQVDLFVAPSLFLRDEFVRFGLSPARIQYSPHGHVSARAVGGEGKRSESADGLRFGYVGSLAQHKGVEILIDAFDRIRRPGVVLNVFGGANVNQAYARRLEKSASNPAIHFKGRFDHTRLAEVYAQIDVLVMPSLCFENAPLTICEAFSAGIPVVASKLGGMAELVRHGENGLLFEPGDAEDLYRQLRALAEQPDRIDDLVGGIEAVKTIERDAADFGERYASLLRGR